MKERLIEELSLFLLKKGFMLKSLDACFDMLARKGEKALLIKVLKDANAVNPELVRQMKQVASYISGSPLIIAESAGVPLEDNVVYSRAGVVTINLETFRNCISSNLPYIKASKAGFTMCVDGSRLRGFREDEGYSVNSLAKKIGVSSRMVSRYEGGGDVSYAKGLKLYDLFGEEVFNQLEVFDKPSMEVMEASSDVSLKYAIMGFNVLETVKTPFDIVSKREDEVILTSVGDYVHKDALTMARMLEADNLVVFQRKRPKVEMPAIAKDDFLEFEEAKEVLKFLKEF